MENIERTQFMVLTGHLDDRPLPDLIRTLRVQRKSGRLQVEYPDAPGAFFFEDGQLVDAQLGALRGLEALYAALALDGASFNFNPLVRPPERSIDRQQQQFITDLVEIPRRENLAEIKIAGGGYPAGALADSPRQAAPLQLAPVAAELIAPLEERLVAVEQAISATSRRFSRERLIYAVVISFLVGLMIVTAVQALLNLRRLPDPATGATTASRQADAAGDARGVTGTRTAPSAAVSPAGVKKEDGGIAPASRAGAADASQATGAAKEGAAATTATVQAASSNSNETAAAGAGRKSGGASSTQGYDVRVLLEVKNGQVTDARVLNPKPGAKAYEARALRAARQRRYPKDFSGGETLKVRVKP